MDLGLGPGAARGRRHPHNAARAPALDHNGAVLRSASLLDLPPPAPLPYRPSSSEQPSRSSSAVGMQPTFSDPPLLPSPSRYGAPTPAFYHAAASATNSNADAWTADPAFDWTPRQEDIAAWARYHAAADWTPTTPTPYAADIGTKKNSHPYKWSDMEVVRHHQ